MHTRRVVPLVVVSVLATSLASAHGTAERTLPRHSRGSHTAAPRLMISVSRVSTQSPAAGNDLTQAARQLIIETLRRRSDVIVDSGNTPRARRRMRTARMTGHNFDATIRSVHRRGTTVRVTVSIVVSTLAGRLLQFESERTVTLDGAAPQAEALAIRHAFEAAVNSSIEQLLHG